LEHDDMAEPKPTEWSVAQLGHRPGLHVSVNLRGRTVGGVFCEAEQWVSGVVLGLGGDGTYVTIELDQPVGGGERHGLFGRGSKGQDRISVDDPACVRALPLTEVCPDGVPAEIVELARAGKTLKAAKLYRALNGATLDEARAFIARL
jgi:hypothetical protein